MWYSQIAYQPEQLLAKKFFASMLSSESNEIIDIWADDSWTSTFCAIFSNSKPNWPFFVNKVFYSMYSLVIEEMTNLWPNDSLTFTFC